MEKESELIRIIEPKVDFLSYGPILKIVEEETKKETILTPGELVYAASGVTFKGMNFIPEVIELKKEGTDFKIKRDSSIIKSVGAGHASMSTSVGFWSIIQGDSSKLVDSIFTGATYVSALMPSGRRVPITQEEIVVPKGIVEAGQPFIDAYMEVSKKNIQAYELLQTRGVPKQEASKIVQYGHSGGGFLYMPLETLVYFSKLAQAHPEDMPLEGIEIINQLEKKVHENGMGVVYEARKNAPRASNVNPNIFHHRKNLAQETFETLSQEELLFDYNLAPQIISLFNQESSERTKRIIEYLDHRKKLFENPGENWKVSLNELEEIVADYNLSVNIKTIANSPWRVWGEVKRHRTMSQVSESIYNALQRTINERGFASTYSVNQDPLEYAKELSKYISIPQSVASDKENLRIWEDRFAESFLSYKKFIEAGIKESDAIALIPRGVKFATIKEWNLYNLTTGFGSLRQCKGTVEPEMYATTKKELDLIKSHPAVDENVKKLIAPKCNYGGFCPEADYKKCCGLVRQVIPNYDEDMHKAIWAKREGEIRTNISQYE